MLTHVYPEQVGPYPAEAALYEERSPVNHVDSLACPLLLLQGDEDEIVPPNQSELMYEAAKAKGIPTYVFCKCNYYDFRCVFVPCSRADVCDWFLSMQMLRGLRGRAARLPQGS
jgi:hypothetical protein